MDSPTPQSPRPQRTKRPSKRAEEAQPKSPTAPPPKSNPPAPKQKKPTTSSKKSKTPSQPTSSSPAPPAVQPTQPPEQPLPPKFRTKAHAEFFSEEIQNRPMVIERTFKITDDDCFPLDLEGNKSRNEICIQVVEEIKWRKWEAMCNIKTPAYEMLVKQFYSNMKIHDSEGEYSTEVVGIPIDFSPSVINSLCNTDLPEAVECYFDKNKDKELPIPEMNEVLCDGQAEWNTNPPTPEKVRYLERSSLNLKAKLWCAFLLGVLMPIKHANTLTKRRLWCLFALMKKEPIDLGLLIAKEMIEARNNINTSLPYAKVISVLLFKNGIPLRFYQQSFARGDIGTSYFNQYIFGIPSRKSTKTPPTPAITQPSSSQPSEPPIGQMDRIERIETSLGSCKADLSDIKAHLIRQDAKMESLHADVKRCLLLLIGKSTSSHITPTVDVAFIETMDTAPDDDELRENTENPPVTTEPLRRMESDPLEGRDNAEDAEAVCEQVEKVVQGIEETSTTKEPLTDEPGPDASVTTALNILVDASLTSATIENPEKKRKRDAAEPDS